MNIVRIGLFAAMLAAAPAFGQDATSGLRIVPFDNPDRPGILKIVSGEGDITISGYSGREVRIKVTSTGGKTVAPEEDPKAKGLKRISGTGFSIMTDRDANAVLITRPMDDTTELDIQVPFATSLKIGGVSTKDAADIQNIVINSVTSSILGFTGGAFEGDIKIQNVNGELEISTLDGDISLTNVSGAAVVNCIDGDIAAVFRVIPENRPMAFSTVDGDIDVTFPERIKATVTASNVDGTVNTDFEMELAPGSIKKAEKGTPAINSVIGVNGKTITGKINGGGSDIQLKTIDGNIYIRKGK